MLLTLFRDETNMPAIPDAVLLEYLEFQFSSELVHSFLLVKSISKFGTEKDALGLVHSLFIHTGSQDFGLMQDPYDNTLFGSMGLAKKFIMVFL